MVVAGGSVTKEQLSHELDTFRTLGFGGVEIQPFTFGLNHDELAQDAAIHTVGAPGFYELLAHTLQEGRAKGL